MDDQQRVSAPTASAANTGGKAHSKKMFGMGTCSDKNCQCCRKTRTLKAVLLVVVVILIALVVWGFASWGMNSESKAVNKSEYQAVFLTNGQVYFGKLAVVNPGYLKLTDIYYLQVQSSSNGTTSASQLSATASTTGSNVQLVKLGNELQGPEDMMAINREQVLFWENLKPSGKVTQAIDKYQQ